MIVAGISQKKASTLCSPRQSPVENSPGKNEIPTIKTTNSGGCCRRLNDGAGKGSIASKKENQRRQPSGSELRSRPIRPKFLYDLAMRILFVSILKVAGLEKEVLKQKEVRIMYMNLASSRSTRPRWMGWYIESREIEFQEKTGQGSTADIYRAIWRGFDVAVKCIFPAFFLSNESGVNFLALLKNLTLYPDSGILACCNSWGHALTDSPNNAWVVTEILGMTLKEWLQGPGSRRNERSVPIPPFHN
ncbi:hypothetical protein OIU84_010143 [Salix udensis]|uniref:Uncharacterized protein n=1 Tax=Salix udensis TaxID=889485 RepID=A0AAD6NV59_9ROSI|nr:hypothetical protein OIU84_010143 [Salix udensis]